MRRGLADRENRRLISRDTIFRLYSQTKPDDSSKCYDPDGKRTFGSRGVLYPSICLRILILKTAEIRGTSPATQIPLRIH